MVHSTIRIRDNNRRTRERLEASRNEEGEGIAGQSVINDKTIEFEKVVFILYADCADYEVLGGGDSESTYTTETPSPIFFFV